MCGSTLKMTEVVELFSLKFINSDVYLKIVLASNLADNILEYMYIIRMPYKSVLLHQI